MEPERLDELLRGPAPGEAAARERARLRIAEELAQRPAGAAAARPGRSGRGGGGRARTRRGAQPAGRGGRRLGADGGRPAVARARRRRAGRWGPLAVRRAAARLLRRVDVDRRGGREAPAARRLDGRLMVAARALRRRLARSPARRGRPARARALVAAGATAGHAARLWSPSGFRVAYRSGQDLRVVAGDGTGDRLLDPGTFRPMAWRPGRAHVLAYLSGAHIDLVDVDARPPARPHPPPPRPARARVVRGRAPAVRQPPPLAGDLRRARRGAPAGSGCPVARPSRPSPPRAAARSSRSRAAPRPGRRARSR